uniref:Uncharacterized protein n=1 Tax=Aegilops tauschii subsp. strangulata TaxID=200361 RepID=A0A453DH83_AEGTS
GNESELGDIHVSAREGAIDDVKKHLAAGVQINIRGLFIFWCQTAKRELRCTGLWTVVI